MTLRASEKIDLVDQILTIVEQFYVHRAMKQAQYGVDAGALLRGLRARAANMPDLDFHQDIAAILSRLRDRHVDYGFPFDEEYCSLPFKIERAFEGGRPIYLVTESREASLPVGSTVLRWNEVPTEAAIIAFSRHIGAGNDASRRALATRYITTDRNIGAQSKPDEDQVLLAIVDPAGKARDVTVKWAVVGPAPAAASIKPASKGGEGLDQKLQRINKELFQRFVPAVAPAVAPKYTNVRASTIDAGGKKFGYLRIFDFEVDDAQDFARYVAGLVAPLPRTGLVIDVRNNPGGTIDAGELLIQLFAKGPVAPNEFRFRASEAVAEMLEGCDVFGMWKPTVEQGSRLGIEHSATFSLIGKDGAYNELGRVYDGPSILIADATTYSTGDMFTAAYRDNGVGPLICTDENTGAGGANNWNLNYLRNYFPAFCLPESCGAEFLGGRLGPLAATAFADNNQPLSPQASLSPPSVEDGETWWTVRDGPREFYVQKADWLRKPLGVYFPHGNRFVSYLPDGVRFSFSIRQAVRRGLSDGLVLEDEGMTADYYYKMTRTDLLSSNKDLLAFACARLVAGGKS